MILVTNGKMMSLMKFGRGWKYLNRKTKDTPTNNYFKNTKGISTPSLFEKGEPILWDSNMSLKSDDFRWQDFMVVNGSRMGKLVADDIEGTMTLFDKLDIPRPETLYAKNIEEAISLAEDFDSEKMVIRPSNQVCETRDEAVSFLESNGEYLKGDKGVALQEYIDGQRISCEVWIGKKGVWRKSLNNILKAERFLSGDLGVPTNGEYNLVWFPSKLTSFGLMTVNIGKWFYDQGVVGSVTVDYIVDRSGQAYATGLSTDLSMSHFGTMSMIDSYMGIEDFLTNLYTCDWDIQPTERNRYNFCLRVTVPPYPDTDDNEEFHTQTVRIDDDIPPTVTFIPECCSPEKMELYDYSVGYVVGSSLRWTEAVNDAYDYARKGIRTVNKQYRSDAVNELSERMARLGSSFK